MVNESGNLSFLNVATPRDFAPFSAGAPSRRLAATGNIPRVPTGMPNRPVISTFVAQVRVFVERRAEAASQLRQFQSSLGHADELLAKIKEQLLNIVKQYPPFAQDDPQRLAYLNAITGLRKQLDALTFPPEQTQRDASSASGPGLEEVPSLPANPLKGDLSIPDLDPASAADEDVQQALTAVNAIHDKVKEVRAALWQDVVRYVGESNLGLQANSRAQAQAGQVRDHLATNAPMGAGLGLGAVLFIGE